jgi:hypothetical protein
MNEHTRQRRCPQVRPHLAARLQQARGDQADRCDQQERDGDRGELPEILNFGFWILDFGLVLFASCF